MKEKLFFQLTNFGNPFIHVEDANFENKGELLLGTITAASICARTTRAKRGRAGSRLAAAGMPGHDRGR